MEDVTLSNSYNPLNWLSSTTAAATTIASSNTGIAPHKPGRIDTKPTTPSVLVPAGLTLKYNAMSELVIYLANFQKKLADADTILDEWINDIKRSGPSSPRRDQRLFKSQVSTDQKPEKTPDKKAEHKAIPFTEAAIAEMIEETLVKTNDAFKALNAIDNEAHHLSDRYLEKGALIKLCTANKSIAFEYSSLLNRIQFTLGVWRAPEQLAEKVMDAFHVGMIKAVTTDLIDEWLYKQIEVDAQVLKKDLNKVMLEIDRAKAWVDNYKKPPLDTLTADSIELPGRAATPVAINSL